MSKHLLFPVLDVTPTNIIPSMRLVSKLGMASYFNSYLSGVTYVYLHCRLRTRVFLSIPRI